MITFSGSPRAGKLSLGKYRLLTSTVLKALAVGGGDESLVAVGGLRLLLTLAARAKLLVSMREWVPLEMGEGKAEETEEFVVAP